jgi:cysteinyl-tRNA synthetase
MSKSLGNFITIKDALKKYSPEAIKLLFLQAHYSSSMDFSEEKIAQADSALERFHIFFDKAERNKKSHKAHYADGNIRQGIDALRQAFIDDMDDDFNTPKALGRLFEIMTLCYSKPECDSSSITYAAGTIEGLANIFNLKVKKDPDIDNNLESYIKSMLDKRDAFRRKKDFKSADLIRDQLREKGILIEDEKGKTIWRRL